MLIKASTTIQKSPTKFAKVDLTKVSNSIQLHQLKDTDNFQRVSTTIKVLHLEDPITVSGNKCKQDVTIADATGTARLTLWEDDIGKLVQNSCYSLSNVMVRTFRQTKYLTMPKEGSTITLSPDIGDVNEEPPE